MQQDMQQDCPGIQQVLQTMINKLVVCRVCGEVNRDCSQGPIAGCLTGRCRLQGTTPLVGCLTHFCMPDRADFCRLLESHLKNLLRCSSQTAPT